MTRQTDMENKQDFHRITVTHTTFGDEAARLKIHEEMNRFINTNPTRRVVQFIITETSTSKTIYILTEERN